MEVAFRRARRGDRLQLRSDSSRRHVFVALAADYGNLGDLAITSAQVKFLAQTYSDAIIECIPISSSFSAIKVLRRRIRPEDVITLVGGGNTGDMYDDIQYLRELFIRNFHGNQIISFPQTIEFSRSLYGRWARRRARRVYGQHPNLSVMARDTKSFECAKALFGGNRVVLAPDVVLSLDETEPVHERQGVLMVLRTDREQNLGSEDLVRLRTHFGKSGQVSERDTHVGDVRLDARGAALELEAFWAACRESELIVTDRLHGMIFSVITGTPCIAFDSRTGKVGNFYRDWLINHPGVTLADSLGAIATLTTPSPHRSSAHPDLGHLFAERFAVCRVGAGT